MRLKLIVHLPDRHQTHPIVSTSSTRKSSHDRFLVTCCPGIYKLHILYAFCEVRVSEPMGLAPFCVCQEFKGIRTSLQGQWWVLQAQGLSRGSQEGFGKAPHCLGRVVGCWACLSFVTHLICLRAPCFVWLITLEQGGRTDRWAAPA